MSKLAVLFMKYFKIIIIVIISVLLSLLIYNAVFPYGSPNWMGLKFYSDNNQLEVRKLWDWLDLLIVPLSLIFLGWIYQAYEKSKTERKEKENQQNEILDSYFRTISELINKWNLLDKTQNNESRIIARTRTIVAVENLEGERKGQILQFLFESNLIDDEKLNILGANFREVQASGIVLRNTTIKGVHFCDSNFKNTFLDGSSFISCNFSNTNFNGASMENTNLGYSDLSYCKLTNIDLTRVNFEGANLNYADLSNSKITQSQLNGIFKKDKIKLNNTEKL